MKTNQQEKEYDILIAGSGPSGLTAAIYSARANKKTGIIKGPMIGGQLMTTTDIENFPGYKAIKGPELMCNMIKQVEALGVDLIDGKVVAGCKFGDKFSIETEAEKFTSDVFIGATGSSSKLLGIESSFWGKGVSTCATCDGPFFRDRKVAVIGGGNTALEEAIYLSNIASSVYLIHRRSAFRGDKIMQDRVFNNSKIKIYTPFVVENLWGDPCLQGMDICNLQDNDKQSISVDGVFIAIGHNPNTAYLKGFFQDGNGAGNASCNDFLDENGYVKSCYTEKIPATTIPGLFLSGDVVDKKYRQAITSAGYGCMAAMEAITYLNFKE